MKGRLSSTIWLLVVINIVALFAVLILAYGAGAASGGLAIWDAWAAPGSTPLEAAMRSPGLGGRRGRLLVFRSSALGRGEQGRCMPRKLLRNRGPAPVTHRGRLSARPLRPPGSRVRPALW